MELHTLGVNGGYTQKDVTEVARCFTGWTILRPQLGGEFHFNPRHPRQRREGGAGRADSGGRRRKGRREGAGYSGPSSVHGAFYFEEAGACGSWPTIRRRRWWSAWRRPSSRPMATSAKCCETMFDSREFWSRGAYRSKTKSPLEYGGERGAGHGRQRGFRHRPGEPDRPDGRAAVSQDGTHGVFQFEPGVDELGGVDGTHELRSRSLPATRCRVSWWKRLKGWESRSVRRSFRNIRAAEGAGTWELVVFFFAIPRWPW